jgi:hypothetical protein
MTMPHGDPQDLADLADDRPLTYNDAATVYQTSLTAARDRYAELSDRDLSAKTAALLRERGEQARSNHATNRARSSPGTGSTPVVYIRSFGSGNRVTTSRAQTSRPAARP